MNMLCRFKNRFLFFLIVAFSFILFGIDTAHADRGFWNRMSTLDTYVNVINYDLATAHAATVTFYNSSGTSLGATTATIQPGGRWSISVSTQADGLQENTGSALTTAFVGTGSALNPQYNMGTVVISGDAASQVACGSNIVNVGCIHGFTTIATAGLSGFNFTFTIGGPKAAD